MIIPKKNNKFIVVEGIEGAGKHNACLYIKHILTLYGIKNIISVREPGSTDLAEKIRKLLKTEYQTEIVMNKTELLLMYAARLQLVENVIKPALKKGYWVIGDRHDMSTFAYQGGGCQIKKKHITYLRKMCLKNFYPDLTIYLDVNPTVGLNRAYHRSTLDRIEKKNIDFFIRTRKKYLELIKNNTKSITINANYNEKIVKKMIFKKINTWIQQQK
ncbi:MAG: dTMP kinase [Buchnera aphidicola (Eriosoma harunire)]